PPGRPPAGRGGRNRVLRAGVGGGTVPRAAARTRSSRAAARLDGAIAGRAAGALGGAPRPPVRGGRAAAGGACDRGGAAHGARAELVAGARARGRRDASVVHSSDAAAR